MDPGLRPDDSLRTSMAPAIPTTVTPVKTGVHGSAWLTRLLPQGFGLGFAGLMDPGLRRDDSFGSNVDFSPATAPAIPTPVTPVKTGVHGSAWLTRLLPQGLRPGSAGLTSSTFFI
jgi:hypothetical protein